MKYFIISGDPSGDLHGSKLIKGIFKSDPKAEIAFWTEKIAISFVTG